jgi:uncharacterized OB-fold protein
MKLEISQCAQCGLTLFPVRYFCPTCGGSEWIKRAAESGTVTESTVVRHRAGEQEAHALHLASVRTSAGPVVISRLDAAVIDGTGVRLEVDDANCIIAFVV